MEPASQEAIDAIVEKDTWTAEDADELLRQLYEVSRAPDRFRAILAEMEKENPEPSGAAALKIGIARYMLCRFQGALDVLSSATDNRDRHYYQALCQKVLRNYPAALEEFDRAAARDWDAEEIELAKAEVHALAGDLDAARAALKKVASSRGETADFHYVTGLIEELAGRGEQAIEQYQKARKIREGHPAATFRLAYYYDLHGDEEAAVELYTQCLSSPPVHANALLNLAVLYEDAGEYDKAVQCCRRILATNPNHPRAQLFLRDAEASKTMYYDEDQARWIARRNAVLDIPVTDFELSVRARNCLKKMNIRTLGDLVRTSEADLLGYKNFGETSLLEIKEMLDAKGLQLGQELEPIGELYGFEDEPDEGLVRNEGILATPIEQVEFSVRARRALESLDIETLGDLQSKTEAELLACKNFGQTSLNEIRQRLAEYGLRLREPH